MLLVISVARVCHPTCQLHVILHVISHVSLRVMLHVISFLSILLKVGLVWCRIEDSYINAWKLGVWAACSCFSASLSLSLETHTIYIDIRLTLR